MASVAAILVLSLAACVDESVDPPEPTHIVDRYEAQPAETRTGHYMPVLEFTGSANPATGELTIETVTRVGARDGDLATVEQGVGWCDVPTPSDGAAGSGPTDTGELVTDPATISVDPIACAASVTSLHGGNEALIASTFDVLGVFCAEVTFRHFYGQTLTDVHAEITTHSNPVEQAGFNTELGGTSSASPGIGRNPPISGNGGLFSYGNFGLPNGTIDASATTCADPDAANCGDEARITWTFRRGSDTPFAFSGVVRSRVEESCGDGDDDDCDGRIDNDCNLYADGTPCLSHADCQSASCEGASLVPEVLGTCTSGDPGALVDQRVDTSLFGPFPSFSVQLYDDFTVPAGGATISEVIVTGAFPAGDNTDDAATAVLGILNSNAEGAPDFTTTDHPLVANVPLTLVDGSDNDFAIELPDLPLAEGVYWLNFAVVPDFATATGEWQWDSGAHEKGFPAVMFNPSFPGFCFGTLAFCGLTPAEVDLSFAIY